ncbi:MULTISPECIES: 5-(carboxyamino)imidazole ribonucleotide mutase [unclassified Curtobacterium]|uniref:5-(carboxyamino)imidazole ribonucleotide mutase n=1 Tax=unclassified Curtobacterium TaxID=257496 RepID=UPI000DA8FC76|nr:MULTISPECIES: 5-(carboxyamino)imidazole ribonucleotide mutase [unclassified Curtobacterium]PZE26589.1 5-(carboxyamino)imidazole ribonucleotide mutase [Curtobacterium sp. MCBD17_028]PZE75152.1 5-(carboxyamino)imidazole ribonucleotide mutase [Curtobacterium sp. MCBD17_019]PZF58683.1 5-(carboxyamino)imidazole ribonucleotide mutase [Curtobacterium sp. MCBD17_034]PZF64531.1 5-(carboxyamino)imidazole ribonucleotide mutase [Curtobacterium sp. MCBD17_013]PZM34673.1 5-(carboxyamino)imidazole ribonuc
MGSDSDWPTMRAAAEILTELGIPFEADVVSAHRTPDKMMRFGREAAGRGIQVVIAGAGGAAHLPGMLAAVTTLPVIGVPVQLARLDGLDSLLSIVQMPAGVPVATVSINGAANAGLLAARIIGSADAAVSARLADYAAGLEDLVEQKAAALRAQL